MIRHQVAVIGGEQNGNNHSFVKALQSFTMLCHMNGAFTRIMRAFVNIIREVRVLQRAPLPHEKAYTDQLHDIVLSTDIRRPC